MSMRYFHSDDEEDIYVSSKIMSKVVVFTKEIGRHAQNMITILDSTINIIMRHFHSDDEESIYVSSKVMNKVAMASIWIK